MTPHALSLLKEKRPSHHDALGHTGKHRRQRRREFDFEEQTCMAALKPTKPSASAHRSGGRGSVRAHLSSCIEHPVVHPNLKYCPRSKKGNHCERSGAPSPA